MTVPTDESFAYVQYYLTYHVLTSSANITYLASALTCCKRLGYSCTMATFKSFVMNIKAFGNLFCNPQKSFHTSIIRVGEV